VIISQKNAQAVLYAGACQFVSCDSHCLPDFRKVYLTIFAHFSVASFTRMHSHIFSRSGPFSFHFNRMSA